MADNQIPVPAAMPTTDSKSTNPIRAENMERSEQRERGAQRGGEGQRGGRGNRARANGKVGGRGRGRDEGRKRRDMGRGEWDRTSVDKRKRNSDEQEARRKKREENGEDPDAGLPFSREEIASEERRPKKKVAVLVGYAGTGYKGMQLNAKEKTIEGDLFAAFIAASAISKANADDPKKSSLVRCARTDKGVHAAGNVISLKLIVEDPDIVAKINEHLPPQIRVWGIERTTGSFSCYQTCDSRWYEYLIPTYCFIPPHPESFLGKKLVESSEQEGIHETYQARQEDVADFWKKAEEEYVKPVLDKLSPELRAEVMNELFRDAPPDKSEKAESKSEAPKLEDGEKDDSKQVQQEGENVEDSNGSPSLKRKLSAAELEVESPDSKKAKPSDAEPEITNSAHDELAVESKSEEIKHSEAGSKAKETAGEVKEFPLSPLAEAVKEVKAAYIAAKRAYRISDSRRKAVQDALNVYLGTINFHNYTVEKGYKDASAKRVIRSFNVGNDPIIINNTEWLSLKVHGQSFMMHQIRKMVAMVALVVRCGTGTERMRESFGPDRMSIPKAPGLGLLLERPVFDTYNNTTAKEYSKEKLDFGKFEKEMEEFKQKEIYERIFRVENEKNEFHTFFNHIDQYRTSSFLWLTAGGVRAVRQFRENNRGKEIKANDVDSDDEGRKPTKEEG